MLSVLKKIHLKSLKWLLQGILIPMGSFESSFRTSFGGLGILFVVSCELWNEQIAGPLLDAAQIKSMVEEFKQVITASSTRKKERAERTQTEDFDAEEGELLEEENEQEEEVFDQVNCPALIRVKSCTWM